MPFAIDPARMWQLARLGSPAAVQITLEVGVFAAVSGLAARITPAALAANQIVLNIAAFFFMVPFGLSSAAAVRVGQAVGRRDAAGVRLAGWAALALSGAFTVAASVVFVVTPLPLLRIFTRDATVLATARRCSSSARCFSRSTAFRPWHRRVARPRRHAHAMLVNLVGHCIGLPVAYCCASGAAGASPGSGPAWRWA